MVDAAILGPVSQTIFDAAGGDEALLRLAHAWHARCLADPVVSHAFSHGYHPQHSERVAAYWAQALGGPSDYTEFTGDPSSVVRMHSGNGEHLEMDEGAQTCFAQALDDAGLPDDPVCEPRSRPTFAGQLQQCQRTRSRQTMSRPVSRWHAGLEAAPRKQFQRPVLERAYSRSRS